MLRRPPRSTLFPYPPLFRSQRLRTPRPPGSCDAGRHAGRRTVALSQAEPQRCAHGGVGAARSEEHTSELQSQSNLVCRLLLEKKKKVTPPASTTYYSSVDVV